MPHWVVCVQCLCSLCRNAQAKTSTKEISSVASAKILLFSKATTSFNTLYKGKGCSCLTTYDTSASAELLRNTQCMKLYPVQLHSCVNIRSICNLSHKTYQLYAFNVKKRNGTEQFGNVKECRKEKPVLSASAEVPKAMTQSHVGSAAGSQQQSFELSFWNW